MVEVFYFKLDWGEEIQTTHFLIDNTYHMSIEL